MTKVNLISKVKIESIHYLMRTLLNYSLKKIDRYFLVIKLNLDQFQGPNIKPKDV